MIGQRLREGDASVIPKLLALLDEVDHQFAIVTP